MQDIDEIVNQAAQQLKALVADLEVAPAGIGISCPMHGLLLLDADRKPLGPVMTWADVRPQAVMNDFSKEQCDRLLQRTGTPVHPMSPLVKLRWLAQYHPDQLENAVYFADLKSYLVDRWTTDGLLLDEQLASATGLLDLEIREWWSEAMTVAGNGTATELAMPEVKPAKTLLSWKVAVAEDLGTKGIPLYLGGSDGCLANLGSGLLEPGRVALTIGTSGAVRVTHRGIHVDPQHQLFNYILIDDYAVLGGATNNGGKVMEWLYDLMSAHFDGIGEMIEAATQHETDLEFKPHLYGERAPLWDAMARAGLSNLHGSHGPLDLARAALVGVTDNIVEILRQVEGATRPAEVIYASGGFTRSDGWVNLLAERADRRVEIAHTPQASAYGAALVARMGVEDLEMQDLVKIVGGDPG